MPSGVFPQRSVALNAAPAVGPQDFFCSFETKSSKLFGSSFGWSIACAVYVLHLVDYLGPACFHILFWSGVIPQRSMAHNAATVVYPHFFFCSFERRSFKLSGSSFSRSIARAVHALRLVDYLGLAHTYVYMYMA